MGWMYLVVPMTLLLLVLTPALVLPLVAGRRKHLLEMRREEARIAEARAKELELRQRRAELEYREALLELERFDRRTGGPAAEKPGALGGPPPDPATGDPVIREDPPPDDPDGLEPRSRA